MNHCYIAGLVRRCNQSPSDELLYRIGTQAPVLFQEDMALVFLHQNGGLNPEQRYRVLNWIVKAGLEIEADLALLIFGRQQLEEWLQISRQAYPDFEFYLSFEYLTRFQSGWRKHSEADTSRKVALKILIK